MIEDLLKKALLKNTKQRHMILSIIKSEKKPVTAEEIYIKLNKNKGNINLSTVYRTLNILSEKNILLKILKEDGTASYQINDNLHNHYITCYKCHNSILIDKCPIKDFSEKISKDTGYVITGHSLQLTGLCPKCSKHVNND
ncbi:MAG: transcriptional repressor [Tissierellia bacterium]|nr:transcriptional repressor [Tissierellia bacterium]MDD4780378.1 transcriptional repressor [Tissierellia bacterium]